jgi:hypothetical protein
MESRKEFLIKMLRRIGFNFCFIIFLGILESQSSHATTNCVQSFNFLFATADYVMRTHHGPIFWIVEDVGGECWYSLLIQIVVKDTIATAFYTRFRDYGSWTWLEKNSKYILYEPAKELENKNDVWSAPDMSWFIKIPSIDSAQLKWLQEKCPEFDGRWWNCKYGIDGISLPSFEGIDVKLVYYYPDGVYFDYKISKAYYFVRSGYILLFTKQPRLADGFDTRHGFLLLKII